MISMAGEKNIIFLLRLNDHAPNPSERDSDFGVEEMMIYEAFLSLVFGIRFLP